MVCYCCDEKIQNEAVVIDFGIYGKLYFCNDDCKEKFIEDRTYNVVFDEEL